MIRQYGYLEDFINELRSNERYAFKKSLQRLKKKKKKEIALIKNEFYVVITPEYRSKGTLPHLYLFSGYNDSWRSRKKK